MNNIIKAQTRGLKLDPNALEKVRLPLEDCPNEFVRYLIDAYSIKYHTTPEFNFGSFISAIGTVAGSNFRWSNGTHYNYPQFFTMLLGPASCAKSDGLSRLLESVFDINERERKQYESMGYTKEQIAENPFVGIITNGRFSLPGYQSDLSHTSKGETLVIDELLTFFGSIHCLNFKDYSDEASYFTFAYNKPEEGYDITFKNKACSRHINMNLVRIAGTFQEGLVNKYFAKSPLFDLGLFARFMIFTFDRENLRPRDESFNIDPFKNKYRCIIEAIYNQKSKIKVVSSVGAGKIYSEYISENDKARDNSILSNYEEVVLGKLEVFIIRLAMTLAIFRTFKDGEPFDGNTIVIQEEEMLFSRRCMDYFFMTGNYFNELANGVEEKKSTCSKTETIISMIKNRNLFGWSEAAIARMTGLKGVQNIYDYKKRYNIE